MKEIYMEKEDAVSPVIATILMVAITVVLAATVYILVSHYTSTGASVPLAATLSVINEGQGGTTGSPIYYYNLSLSLTTPVSFASPGNIHITVNGNTVSQGSSGSSSGTGSLYAYIINPDDNGVKGWTTGGTDASVLSGATIEIVSSTPLSGETVSLTYPGYTGAATVTLP